MKHPICCHLRGCPKETSTPWACGSHEEQPVLDQTLGLTDHYLGMWDLFCDASKDPALTLSEGLPHLHAVFILIKQFDSDM